MGSFQRRPGGLKPGRGYLPVSKAIKKKRSRPAAAAIMRCLYRWVSELSSAVLQTRENNPAELVSLYAVEFPIEGLRFIVYSKV